MFSLHHISQTLRQLRSKPVDDIPFQSGGALMLGIGVELQLIEPETGELLPRSEEFLEHSKHLKKVKNHLYQSTLEVVTDQCLDVLHVEKDLCETLEAIAPIAKQLGIKLSATGVHPFSTASNCLVSPQGRYRVLSSHNQWLARQHPVFGLNIAVGMVNGDLCIRFSNLILQVLPHLLALSASAPYYQGADTGLATWRPVAYEMLPTSGLPHQVWSWREFEQLCHKMKVFGAIESIDDLCWDLQPNPDCGTLDIRVCDSPATLCEVLAITAFIHMLAHWFADHGNWKPADSYPPLWLLQENKWRATSQGLDANLVMNTDGASKPIRKDIRDWLNKLKPYSIKLGYQRYLSNLENILVFGNSSDRQRRHFQKHLSFKSLMGFNMAEFHRHRPDSFDYENQNRI